MADILKILRIVIVVLCAVGIALPWAWTNCVICMSSLSSMGLCIVGLTIAASLIANDGGDTLHCETIEGIMGFLFLIAGLLQVQYASICNILFLVFLIITGALFITNMALLLAGKA